MSDLSLQLSIIGWMGLAIVLGGLVGLERERSGRAAGTRTHMLVAGAACLVTGVGAHAVLAAGLGDPTRGMYAVVSGIGFLGAGAILRPAGGKDRPSGLTTAASVFFVAGIGSAVGLGFAVVATGATFLTLLTLRGVRILEHALGRPEDEAAELGDDDDADLIG